MFMSVCIFAWMVCASALSFLDGKICAVREPSIIIIAGQASFATTLTFLDFPSVYTVSAQPSAVQCGRQSRLNLAFPECMAWAAVRSKQRCSSRRFSCVQATSAQKNWKIQTTKPDVRGRKRTGFDCSLVRTCTRISWGLLFISKAQTDFLRDFKRDKVKGGKAR